MKLIILIIISLLVCHTIKKIFNEVTSAVVELKAKSDKTKYDIELYKFNSCLELSKIREKLDNVLEEAVAEYSLLHKKDDMKSSFNVEEMDRINSEIKDIVATLLSPLIIDQVQLLYIDERSMLESIALKIMILSTVYANNVIKERDEIRRKEESQRRMGKGVI